MTADAPRRRRSVLLPALITVVALCVLIGLGLWQVERLAWKEALIATLTERLAAPAIILPADQWARLEQATDEFRRVRVRVGFANDMEARVYSGGGGLRDDIKGPGYFAFAPAAEDGHGVVVNRGFVSNPTPDASLRPIAVPDKPIDIVGVLRWPEQAPTFVTPYSERQDLWLVRNHLAMWTHYGWGKDARFGPSPPAPFYIEQESPVPPGGVPKPGPLAVKLRNDHFGYALTWFGLAGVLAGVFAFWLRGRWRDERQYKQTGSHSADD